MAPCPIQIRSLQFWGKSNMRRWTPGTTFFAVLATNSARLWATIITTRTRAHLAVRRSLISYLIAYPQSIAQFSSSQRMIHGIRSGLVSAGTSWSRIASSSGQTLPICPSCNSTELYGNIRPCAPRSAALSGRKYAPFRSVRSTHTVRLWVVGYRSSRTFWAMVA
jgi:hypothetical protein